MSDKPKTLHEQRKEPTMHHRVDTLRAWEYDRYGRLVAVTVKRSYGYEVQQARRLGDWCEVVQDPEDAERLAAVMGRGRR